MLSEIRQKKYDKKASCSGIFSETILVI